MGLLISHTPRFDNIPDVAALIVHLGVVTHSVRPLILQNKRCT